MGDVNDHLQEWLGCTTTNRHGVSGFDFVTVSGSDQLIVGSTHARGGTLDLLMTSDSDLKIHISDINYEIADSTVSCFADDTRILLGIKDEEDT